ncbi:MAG TPA: glycosyltransferase, partial [Polyangiaceae bacterium]|nr:glycosyltransferase [Polyangiaceae bacterium]
LVLACRAKTPRARDAERALRERTHGLGTTERTAWLGETARILELLGAADIVALPAEHAYAKMDYPLVLLEAMGLGRPVLVAANTPAAELAEGGAAIAVEPRADAVAGALARLFADGAERERVGISGRNLVLSAHSRERMAEAYELLYDALLP